MLKVAMHPAYSRAKVTMLVATLTLVACQDDPVGLGADLSGRWFGIYTTSAEPGVNVAVDSLHLIHSGALLSGTMHTERGPLILSASKSAARLALTITDGTGCRWDGEGGVGEDHGRYHILADYKASGCGVAHSGVLDLTGPDVPVEDGATGVN